MNIVVLDGFTENPGDLSWGGFEELGNLTVYDRTCAQDVVQRIGSAQAVITNKVVIDKDVMDQCPALRYIGILATGYNVVDIEAAAEKGIVVTNIPAYGTAAVAQYGFGLLLEICGRAGAHSRAVHEGRWTNSPDWCFWDYPLIELAGKTMGVIGLGRIGQNMAQLAKAFGMQVVAHSRTQSNEGEKHARYVPLQELFAVSDVISLHCPLTSETQHLINQNTIAGMKDGVIIINTARGGLINESHLAAALQSGKVYAAGVDVVSKEPIEKDNPLLHAPNCTITPHIAWAPKESRLRLMNFAVENLRAFINGRPVNVVLPA